MEWYDERLVLRRSSFASASAVYIVAVSASAAKRTKIWRRPDHTPCACKPAGTPARAAVGPATCAIVLSSRRVRIESDADDSFTELREFHSGRGRGLRNQARLCHSRQRVRLETIKFAAAFLAHAKIDACITAQLERPKRTPRQLLHGRRLRPTDLRGKFLDGHPCLVLALVVVNLVLRDDFANGQCLVAQDSDRELPPRDEPLDHHFVVVLERLRDGASEILGFLDDAEPDCRALLRRLHHHGQPQCGQALIAK